MATIPQQPQAQTPYYYAVGLLQSGKKPADVEEALVADGLSNQRAKAVVNNLQQAKKVSLLHFIHMHPILHKFEAKLSRAISGVTDRFIRGDN
ncbi:MAG: hypothetical protein H6670_12415 [Anaerolineaceae bacterium]|nr:hypothetical protein [Anaerolineaceae bacterium]